MHLQNNQVYHKQTYWSRVTFFHVFFICVTIRVELFLQKLSTATFRSTESVNKAPLMRIFNATIPQEVSSSAKSSLFLHQQARRLTFLMSITHPAAQSQPHCLQFQLAPLERIGRGEFNNLIPIGTAKLRDGSSSNRNKVTDIYNWVLSRSLLWSSYYNFQSTRVWENGLSLHCAQ